MYPSGDNLHFSLLEDISFDHRSGSDGTPRVSVDTIPLRKIRDSDVEM